ncbi:MAG: lysophospholipid acyltransferase family protein [Saprospiraceae bacterium]|nr:lysophospholipid acyltransferase family protein [Saprospiraceae bacterium]
MSALIYYIALPFIYLLSILPFWILYRISDIMFILVYHVIGYRRKVVLDNLRNSFPEKSETEIQQISKRFFQYFCDLILETIKTLTISPETVKKRLAFDDPALLTQYCEKKQSIILILGHWGNWELAGARFGVEPGIHQLYVIYHPLKNKYFDRLVYHMRTRLGNKLYAMKKTLRGMVGNRKEVTATAFIADQTPSPDNAFWLTFLNQDTPIFMGTEKIAQKFNYPVVYMSVRRVKRGYYEIESELLFDNPKETSEHEISIRHTARLEEDIRSQPELWLWTHRRWKHKRQQYKHDQQPTH